MAMDAGVYFDIGGFDEEFFAYYEDVDLGWRSWVLGHDVRYVPSAVCYHHHSSTSGRVPPERLRVLQVRNPQLACVKNYDDANLARVLPLIQGLAFRRAFSRIGLADADAYRIEALTTLEKDGPWTKLRRGFRKHLQSHDSVDRMAVADFVAMNDVLGRWNHWMQRRKEIQDRRRRSDEEILPLFLDPLWCIEGDPAYGQLQEDLTRRYGLDELFAGLTTLEKPEVGA